MLQAASESGHKVVLVTPRFTRLRSTENLRILRVPSTSLKDFRAEINSPRFGGTHNMRLSRKPLLLFSAPLGSSQFFSKANERHLWSGTLTKIYARFQSPTKLV